jgi:hypothetical protein
LEQKKVFCAPAQACRTSLWSRFKEKTRLSVSTGRVYDYLALNYIGTMGEAPQAFWPGPRHGGFWLL